MILHVTNTKPLPNYCLWLQFDDGTEGYADLSGELWGAMFEPLKDPVVFASATVDPVCKTVTWSNGADLAPEYLKQLLVEQTSQHQKNGLTALTPLTTPSFSGRKNGNP